MTLGVSGVIERAWSGRTSADRVVRCALVPAALVYGAAVSLRNHLYDRGWLAVRRVPARVLSVGNVVAGGTGKTPTALWLAERLAARGQRVGIVARGYRKRRRGVVVVSEGRGPLVSPEEGGDEAVLLAHRFAGPVITGERRAEAAAFAAQRFGLDTIVLDDGFQHRALARDADLVLTTDAPAFPWPLPAGPLREPATALARARAVLAIGAEGELAAPPRVPAGVAAFRGRLVATALVWLAGDTWLAAPVAPVAGRPVTALAGIARPERFVALLARLGATVVRTLVFPDHHQYGARDLAAIAEAARSGPVVTTEKDLVKLAHLPGTGALRALRVAVEVEQGEALVDRLLAPAGPAAGRRELAFSPV
jgi:tetraacyldisaccharide 4'-kinase